MVQQRKRVRHTETFEERLSKEAVKFKEAADKLPPGSFARELLLRRVTQAEKRPTSTSGWAPKFQRKLADAQSREPERLEIGTVAPAVNLT